MRVLVVAAHPDDEILSAGGALARHHDQGDETFIHILGTGVTARLPHVEHQQAIEALRESTNLAARIVGAANITFSAFGDQILDRYALLEITQAIEAVVNSVKPEVVYTHSVDDLNRDHSIVASAVLTACRPVPGGTVKRILSGEIQSSTEWGYRPFDPTVFLPLTESQLERKLAALGAYRQEMRPSPHARSLEAVQALARWRGASVGATAAEAFRLVREVA